VGRGKKSQNQGNTKRRVRVIGTAKKDCKSNPANTKRLNEGSWRGDRGGRVERGERTSKLSAEPTVRFVKTEEQKKRGGAETPD